MCGATSSHSAIVGQLEMKGRIALVVMLMLQFCALKGQIILSITREKRAYHVGIVKTGRILCAP